MCNAVAHEHCASCAYVICCTAAKAALRVIRVSETAEAFRPRSASPRWCGDVEEMIKRIRKKLFNRYRLYRLVRIPKVSSSTFDGRHDLDLHSRHHRQANKS